MTETEYLQQVDEAFEAIEEILDGAESDLDYETNGGMMTVQCENGSQIIFTRQPPLKQLWVATRDGGFHFDYDTENSYWVRDNDGARLADVLKDAFQSHAEETFDFSAL